MIIDDEDDNIREDDEQELSGTGSPDESSAINIEMKDGRKVATESLEQAKLHMTVQKKAARKDTTWGKAVSTKGGAGYHNLP